MYERLVPVDHGSSGGSSGQRVRARRWRKSAISASGTCSVNGRGAEVAHPRAPGAGQLRS